LKGIGLRDTVSIESREFQIHTGNDPQKNLIKSEIFEQGKFLFSNEDDYDIRERSQETLDIDFLKSIAFDQHQNILDELKTIFKINEKIKQIRQHMPHFRLGRVFLNRNFVSEAIENLQRVVELKPDFVRGHSKLGVALFQDGKYMEAVKAFLQAHKLNPDYPDVLNQLGVGYTRVNNFSAASKFLKKALEINPGYTEANFNLGVVLFLSSLNNENEEEKAVIPARFIRSFKEIIKQPKYQYRGWHEKFINTQEVLNKGNVKEVKGALYKIQSEILLADDSSDIMDYFFLQFMYGGSELKNNKLEVFEELINSEVEKHSDYADYWNELGVIHLIKCREYFLKAISEFERSNKLEPEFESAKRNTELLKHNKQGFLILLRAILK